MSQLGIALLGAFEITLDGKPIAVPLWSKTRALLAYLAIEAEIPHSRFSLAGLLWSEQPEQDAHNSLRQAIHQLRRAFCASEPAHLLIALATVQFNQVSDHALDTNEFASLVRQCREHTHRRPETCPVCIERLQRAAELYRGAFLAGFFLKDSPEFEEWVLIKREQHERMALQVFNHLAENCALRGDLEGMEQMARRQIAMDPLRESAHRQLMRAYAWSGQRAEALADYANLYKLLAQEVNAPPEKVTTELRNRIEANAERAPTAPPLRNWQSYTTSFVGRQQELVQVAGLLGNPNIRLVTLVGPGGIGKTRLALQSAQRAALDYRDGACFVSLVNAREREQVMSAIATALQISLSGTMNLEQQVLGYLRAKELLLILDSCEQLAEDATMVSRILQLAPHVTILATSREPLNIQAEWVLPIAGFPMPGQTELDALEQYDVVQLFAQRAARVRPGYELANPDRAPVARICQLVGGMPLAVELAAPWVAVLSCSDIAREIEHNLDLLATRAKDATERHRSIRAAFDQTWKRLTRQEQSAFRQTAVFSGGFRREAAERIIPNCSVSEILAALALKSLLQTGAAGRYAEHPLIHQYAQEKLAQDSDEKRQAEERHGCYYTEFVAQQGERLRGPEQLEALALMSEDIENIRAACSWAARGRRVQEISSCLYGLPLFYRAKGWYREGDITLGRFVAALQNGERGPAAQLPLGFAMANQGLCCFYLGDNDRAQSLLEAALELLRPLGARRESALALGYLGIVLVMTGKGTPGQGKARAQEGLELAEQSGDRWLVGLLLFCLGQSAREVDAVAASNAFRKSAAVLKEVGDRFLMGLPLYTLGEMTRMAGKLPEVRALLEEGRALAQSIGSRQMEAWCLSSLAEIAAAKRDFPQAARFFRSSAVITEDIGDSRVHILNLAGLGTVAFIQRDYDTASSLWKQVVELGERTQTTPVVMKTVVRLADAMSQGDELDRRQAAILLGYALDYPRIFQEDRMLAEKLLARLKLQSGAPVADASMSSEKLKPFGSLLDEMMDRKIAEADPVRSNERRL